MHGLGQMRHHAGSTTAAAHEHGVLGVHVVVLHQLGSYPAVFGGGKA